MTKPKINDLLDEYIEDSIQENEAPEGLKLLYEAATASNCTFLEHIAETGPEVKEIFDRMVLAELKSAREEIRQSKLQS